MLLVSVICYLGTACNSVNWNWEPDPYEPDYIYESIMNANGKEVFCNTPEFNDFTCFTSSNLAALAYEIRKLDLEEKDKIKIMGMFKKINAVQKTSY